MLYGGGGNFGKVYQGLLLNNGKENDNQNRVVAIKTIYNPINKESIVTFLDEIQIMSRLDPHPNLVNMLATHASSFAENREIYLILEYCNHGDLKKFLIENRDLISSHYPKNRGESNLHCSILILFSYDVAKGMEYLARNKIMHGDTEC